MAIFNSFRIFWQNFLPVFQVDIYYVHFNGASETLKKKLSQGGSHLNGLTHTHTAFDRSSAKILSLPFVCVLENNFTAVTISPAVCYVHKFQNYVSN